MTELSASEQIEQLLDKLTVNAVFGQPIQEGDVTLIPVADVVVGFGFGSGQSPADEVDDETENRTGEGGAGGGKATPRGYIKITQDGVRFESTLDANWIPLAGIAMSAWSVFWITKAIRAFARK